MNVPQAADPAPRRESDPLSVSHSVIVEMVRLAALEVPGVLKVSHSGPLAWLAGSPVRVQVGDGRVSVRVWVVVRPGHALRPVAAQIRLAIAATVERLLGLDLGNVTVVVDGVGGWGR
ncbi:MAG: Asp23/Gls24 family envelope stress response protein [Candidatus Limnocylindrales bacterium]|jgi:uncharacterized alkaline shock family protein YloU